MSIGFGLCCCNPPPQIYLQVEGLPLIKAPATGSGTVILDGLALIRSNDNLGAVDLINQPGVTYYFEASYRDGFWLHPATTREFAVWKVGSGIVNQTFDDAASVITSGISYEINTRAAIERVEARALAEGLTQDEIDLVDTDLTGGQVTVGRSSQFFTHSTQITSSLYTGVNDPWPCVQNGSQDTELRTLLPDTSHLIRLDGGNQALVWHHGIFTSTPAPVGDVKSLSALAESYDEDLGFLPDVVNAIGSSEVVTLDQWIAFVIAAGGNAVDANDVWENVPFLETPPPSAEPQTANYLYIEGDVQFLFGGVVVINTFPSATPADTPNNIIIQPDKETTIVVETRGVDINEVPPSLPDPLDPRAGTTITPTGLSLQFPGVTGRDISVDTGSQANAGWLFITLPIVSVVPDLTTGLAYWQSDLFFPILDAAGTHMPITRTSTIRIEATFSGQHTPLLRQVIGRDTVLREVTFRMFIDGVEGFPDKPPRTTSSSGTVSFTGTFTTRYFATTHAKTVRYAATGAPDIARAARSDLTRTNRLSYFDKLTATTADPADSSFLYVPSTLWSSEDFRGLFGQWYLAEESSFSQIVTTTGMKSPIVFSLQNAPSWMSINGSGRLSGSTKDVPPSTGTVTVTATDAAGFVSSDSFDWEVLPLPANPVSVAGQGFDFKTIHHPATGGLIRGSWTGGQAQAILFAAPIGTENFSFTIDLDGFLFQTSFGGSLRLEAHIGHWEDNQFALVPAGIFVGGAVLTIAMSGTHTSDGTTATIDLTWSVTDASTGQVFTDSLIASVPLGFSALDFNMLTDFTVQPIGDGGGWSITPL